MTRKFWAGVTFVGAAIAIYGLRGLPSWYDLWWHAGVFVLGVGLMLSDKDFRATLATIRAVFGKGEQ